MRDAKFTSQTRVHALISVPLVLCVHFYIIHDYMLQEISGLLSVYATCRRHARFENLGG